MSRRAAATQTGRHCDSGASWIAATRDRTGIVTLVEDPQIELVPSSRPADR